MYAIRMRKRLATSSDCWFDSDGGVANTVVYLKNISQGKAMDLPESRQHTDQKSCRYVPHIMLVPQGNDLQIKYVEVESPLSWRVCFFSTGEPPEQFNHPSRACRIELKTSHR
jgi:hypothetical protein